MGNTCSGSGPLVKGSPADVEAPSDASLAPPCSLLRANIGGDLYRGATSHAVTLRRGHDVAEMIPYERRAVRLAVDELRDDKATRVFSFRRTTCAAAGLRVSVVRAVLRADPAQVVRFRCTAVLGHARLRIVEGDMRDLALWNVFERAERGAHPDDLHRLPVVPGLVSAHEELEFEVTTAAAVEPAVYVTSHVVDPLTLPAHVRDFGGFGGKFLMPTFARRAAGQTGPMHICDGGAVRLIAFVLVKTRSKLSRLAIVEAGREIVSVPADVARFDAQERIACASGEYYCVVLDGGSWTWDSKPGSINTLRVGGALDSSTLGDLSLSVETEADDGASDVHAMVGNWFNA